MAKLSSIVSALPKSAFAGCSALVVCLPGAAILDRAPLAHEELTLEFKEFAEHRLKVPAFHFRMMPTDTGEEAGGINLRVTANEDLLFYAGHVGYVVHEKHRERRFAARSVRLLLPLAQVLALDPLWITCNPENAASIRTCELAGGKFAGIVDVPEDTETYREGMKQKCRFRFDLSDAIGGAVFRGARTVKYES